MLVNYKTAIDEIKEIRRMIQNNKIQFQVKNPQNQRNSSPPRQMFQRRLGRIRTYDIEPKLPVIIEQEEVNSPSFQNGITQQAQLIRIRNQQLNKNQSLQKKFQTTNEDEFLNSSQNLSQNCIVKHNTHIEVIDIKDKTQTQGNQLFEQMQNKRRKANNININEMRRQNQNKKENEIMQYNIQRTCKQQVQ